MGKKIADVSLRRLSPRSTRSELSRDLGDLVGKDVYSTWLKMLKELVPHGRTHRLAVVVAGMLRYASACSYKKDSPENDLSRRLQEADEAGMDLEENEELICPLVEQLFKDAGVSWRRTSSRGERYSIISHSIAEFMSWELMPWE